MKLRSSKFEVGDRVKVRAGQEHDAMTKGKTGVISEIATPALAVRFEGSEKPHKWYVDEEVERVNE